MATPPKTAILLVDPYNEFIHPEGKMYPAVSASLKEANTVKHLQKMVKAAHSHKIPIYYCLHQQYTPTAFQGWQHPTALQTGQNTNKVFEEGSWGAKVFEGLEPDLNNGDIMVSKHWSGSSFANTDLDYQLRQRGVTDLVIAGLVANTCIESTARYAYELGYQVTLLSDATAGFSIEQKHAATDITWSLFGNVVTTSEYVATLSDK
ncbi:putative isochorismatase family [Hyphodiscus hymeniophilus]|uniref:Isochorismatase family n=1 Tax=Hyphodiscus hymeniophilus TaxID=353542 RepID=A0A9P6VMY8_9HELO|nr:putative isochorismatase family [Hyphodiscus hymeniophilus]